MSDGRGVGRVVSGRGVVGRPMAVMAALAVLATGIAVAPVAGASGSAKGLLRVTTSPAVGSQISVDGVVRDTWGLNWLKVSTGSHQVCFSDVPAYATPACETVTVADGVTTTVTGNFELRGFLRVVTSPALPSQITVDGVARDNWGLFTDMAAGSHRVCFGAVADYSAPGCEWVTVTAGVTETVTGTFTASPGSPGQSGLGFLRVTTKSPVGAQVIVDGTVRDRWGLIWLQIAPGSHEVCFGDVPGYQTPACEAVTVTETATTAVEGGFTRNGYLHVTTDPPSPSTISVDGTPRDDWGMYTDMAPGDHQVCFGPVAGLITPGCATVTITAGATASTTGTFTPAPPSSAVAMAGGAGHTCALRSNGTVSCWGNNHYGQLGDGTTTDSKVPVAVSGLTDATAIGAGSRHTCAVHANGTVSCWGNNTYGRLGDGTIADSHVPVAVSGLTDAIAISAGYKHTCAVRAGGAVSCWGNNVYGQLGDGTTTDSHVPVGVSGLTDATSITTGEYDTCAVRASGAASCWGSNGSGQLGDGTTTDSHVPVGVSGLTDATAIAAGAIHTCAVRAGGTVSCWGNNFDGLLGNGTAGYSTSSSVPVGVPGLTDATSISVGDYHTCVLESDQSVVCWGDNRGGQLGEGTTTSSHVPVSVTDLADATLITAGDFHSCALRAGGSMSCWGANGFGQFGDGSTTDSSVPVDVTGF